MTETYATCIRGCVRARRHLTDCDDSQCRGCEPRRAEYGRLCYPCHRRFQLMLTQAEIAERWLTGNLVTGVKAFAGKQDHETRGTAAKEPPSPLDVAILDARQQLRDRLACWVDDLCESAGLQGPGRHSVVTDAKYLLTWLSTVEHVEWIGDWWEELAETMRDAHSVAPWRPEFNRLRGIPCPACHATMLGIFGGEEDVTCVGCHEMFTPERYGIWTRMLAEENGQEATG